MVHTSVGLQSRFGGENPRRREPRSACGCVVAENEFSVFAFLNFESRFWVDVAKFSFREFIALE